MEYIFAVADLQHIRPLPRDCECGHGFCPLVLFNAALIVILPFKLRAKWLEWHRVGTPSGICGTPLRASQRTARLDAIIVMAAPITLSTSGDALGRVNAGNAVRTRVRAWRTVAIRKYTHARASSATPPFVRDACGMHGKHRNSEERVRKTQTSEFGPTGRGPRARALIGRTGAHAPKLQPVSPRHRQTCYVCACVRVCACCSDRLDACVRACAIAFPLACVRDGSAST